MALSHPRYGIPARILFHKCPQMYFYLTFAFSEDIFLKKWGNDLTQIFILRKDFSNILEEKGLEDLFKKGKFGELIRKILQQKS